MRISFEIVDGDRTDIKQIADIFKVTFEDTYPNLIGHHTEKSIATMLSRAIENGMKLRLAKVGGRTAGFMIYKPTFLDQLYVRPEFQGKGIGRALVNEVLNEGADSVSLFTLKSNSRAISFYQSAGFAVVREGTSPDEKVPDVEMRWSRNM